MRDAEDLRVLKGPGNDRYRKVTVSLTEEDRKQIKQIAKATRARNAEAARRKSKEIRSRKRDAWQEINRLVRNFRECDPGLREIILFGSLARDEVKSVRFDIDLAVDSEKYLDLVGIALDSSFEVDLVNFKTATGYIRTAVQTDGKVLYRGDQD